MDEQIDRICQALDTIEAHLREEINVSDMADVCGYSLFHFIRLFNQFVRHTPYDYLIRRRLCKAARAVLSSQARLIDIAVDFRFQSAETFSRAFYRVYRTQPSRARKTGWLDKRLMLQARTAAHLFHFQQKELLHPYIKQIPERYIAGYTIQEKVTVSKIMELIGDMKSDFPENSEWSLINVFPVRGRKAGPVHFFGCEIENCLSLPLHLSARHLPKSSCAVFQHQGTFEELTLTRDYIYQTWRANTDEQLDLSYEVCHFSENDNIKDIRIFIPIKS